MKLKKKNRAASGLSSSAQASSSNGMLGEAVNRRTFLRNSGITAGGAALAFSGGTSMLKKAQATAPKVHRYVNTAMVSVA